MKRDLVNMEPYKKIYDFSIENYPLKEHLFWYDGPLLSLRMHKNGNPVLFLNIDWNEQPYIDRWMVIETDQDMLSEFINKNIDIEMIIKDEYISHVFIIDFNENNGISEAWEIEKKLNPYMPMELAYA